MKMLAAIIGVALTVGPANADSLRWRFKNNTDHELAVKLYSSDRRNQNWQWPTSSTNWVLDPYDITRTYDISCNYGEKICWGAWRTENTTIFYGVGHSLVQPCTGCCFHCGQGDVPTQNLN